MVVMLVQEIMTRRIESINSDEPVIEACKKYKKHKLGSLIVMEEDTIVRIITERDVIEKIILDAKNPKLTLVKDIMTLNVKTINSLATIEEAVEIMKKYNIKKLPAVYNNIVVGIITENNITYALEIFKKSVKTI
jgi:CBS domain-containing protein